MAEKELDSLQNVEFIEKLGFSRLTFRFFIRHRIKKLEQLAVKTGEQIFGMRYCRADVFTNIVEVLDKNGFRLIDCTEEDYPSVKQYIDEFLQIQLNKKIEEKYSEALTACTLGDISELNLKSLYITTLRKIGINSVSELLGYTRKALTDTKHFGTKGITAIIDALLEHNLALKEETIYDCKDCSTKFATSITLLRTNYYCSACAAKRERIDNMEHVSVTLSTPKYSGFTTIDSGFYILANIKNLTDSLLKVKLVDFYVVSGGRQYSPKFNLTGYSFDEEMMMPKALKSAAKIWDLKDFDRRKLQEGAEVYITLSIPSLNKTLMYKFVLGFLDSWEIDDYFEN